MDKTLEDILTRRSVRKFQDRTVAKENVVRLLNAGMAAPTAANRRPWHFYVVTGKPVLSKLAQANPYGSFIAKAPLAIVVCGDLNKALEGDEQAMWVQDASAASENILLAAHALELGGVWTALYPLKERCDAVKQALSLPNHLVPFCTLAIGYPDQTPVTKDKYDDSCITWL